MKDLIELLYIENLGALRKAVSEKISEFEPYQQKNVLELVYGISSPLWSEINLELILEIYCQINPEELVAYKSHEKLFAVFKTKGRVARFLAMLEKQGINIEQACSFKIGEEIPEELGDILLENPTLFLDIKRHTDNKDALARILINKYFKKIKMAEEGGGIIFLKDGRLNLATIEYLLKLTKSTQNVELKEQILKEVGEKLSYFLEAYHEQRQLISHFEIIREKYPHVFLIFIHRAFSDERRKILTDALSLEWGLEIHEAPIIPPDQREAESVFLGLMDSPAHLRYLVEGFVRRFPEDPDSQLVKKFLDNMSLELNGGKIFFAEADWYMPSENIHHIVNLSVYNGKYIIYSNSGARSIKNKSVQIFKINPELTPEEVANKIKALQQGHLVYSEWEKEFLKIVQEDRINQGKTIVQNKQQKVGNCTFTSMKKSFKTILILQLAEMRGIDVEDLDNIPKDIIEEASAIYKRFTDYIRYENIKHFVRNDLYDSLDISTARRQIIKLMRKNSFLYKDTHVRLNLYKYILEKDKNLLYHIIINHNDWKLLYDLIDDQHHKEQVILAAIFKDNQEAFINRAAENFLSEISKEEIVTIKNNLSLKHMPLIKYFYRKGKHQDLISPQQCFDIFIKNIDANILRNIRELQEILKFNNIQLIQNILEANKDISLENKILLFSIILKEFKWDENINIELLIQRSGFSTEELKEAYEFPLFWRMALSSSKILNRHLDLCMADKTPEQRQKLILNLLRYAASENTCDSIFLLFKKHKEEVLAALSSLSEAPMGFSQETYDPLALAIKNENVLLVKAIVNTGIPIKAEHLALAQNLSIDSVINEDFNSIENFQIYNIVVAKCNFGDEATNSCSATSFLENEEEDIAMTIDMMRVCAHSGCKIDIRVLIFNLNKLKAYIQKEKINSDEHPYLKDYLAKIIANYKDPRVIANIPSTLEISPLRLNAKHLISCGREYIEAVIDRFEISNAKDIAQNLIYKICTEDLNETDMNKILFILKKLIPKHINPNFVAEAFTTVTIECTHTACNINFLHDALKKLGLNPVWIEQKITAWLMGVKGPKALKDLEKWLLLHNQYPENLIENLASLILLNKDKFEALDVNDFLKNALLQTHGYFEEARADKQELFDGVKGFFQENGIEINGNEEEMILIAKKTIEEHDGFLDKEAKDLIEVLEQTIETYEKHKNNLMKTCETCLKHFSATEIINIMPNRLPIEIIKNNFEKLDNAKIEALSKKCEKTNGSPALVAMTKYALANDLELFVMIVKKYSIQDTVAAFSKLEPKETLEENMIKAGFNPDNVADIKNKDIYIVLAKQAFDKKDNKLLKMLYDKFLLDDELLANKFNMIEKESFIQHLIKADFESDIKSILMIINPDILSVEDKVALIDYYKDKENLLDLNLVIHDKDLIDIMMNALDENKSDIFEAALKLFNRDINLKTKKPQSPVIMRSFRDSSSSLSPRDLTEIDVEFELPLDYKVTEEQKNPFDLFSEPGSEESPSDLLGSPSSSDIIDPSPINHRVAEDDFTIGAAFDESRIHEAFDESPLHGDDESEKSPSTEKDVSTTDILEKAVILGCATHVEQLLNSGVRILNKSKNPELQPSVLHFVVKTQDNKMLQVVSRHMKVSESELEDIVRLANPTQREILEAVRLDSKDIRKRPSSPRRII